MADVTVHKQEFLIKDLPTRSVTLYPARANIVRDIHDILLKPGANEITIYGLSPTCDENSIKVDGKGTATITDMTVDLIPNRDLFEDEYPDSEDSSSESESDESDTDDDEMKTLKDERRAINGRIADQQELVSSAAKSLKILESYGETLRNKETKPDDIGSALSIFFDERQKLYTVHKSATDAITDLREGLADKTKEIDKLAKIRQKRAEKIRREKHKIAEKNRRRRAEKRKEKLRLRDERLGFWPKNVYRVILHLDAPSPSSNRNSVVDLKSAAGKASSSSVSTTDSQVITLSLSYITYAASWSPRYDLHISTTTHTATILYRAEFKNMTSETWKDAKVVLSTSQTSYSGLWDTVPIMQPWHVRLAKGGHGGGGLFGSSSSNSNNAAWAGGLQSAAEQAEKVRAKKDMMYSQQSKAVDRSNLFAKGSGPPLDYGSVQPADFSNRVGNSFGATQQAAAFGPSQSVAFGQPQATGFVGSGGGLFGSTQSNVVQAPQVQALQRSQAPSTLRRMAAGFAADEQTDDSYVGGPPGRGGVSAEELRAAAYLALDDEEDDGATLSAPHEASLTHQESTTEETGLTTTYDVPGLRTLVPSPLVRRHKIASVEVKNVQLWHILVPKLRPAAFLKCRLRNSGTVTLLRGTAGLTLDGTFLGNCTVPRCSPGETFSMPLGVDPSVHVVYAKPTVRRSSSGVFNKEDTVVYTRTCWVTNSKPHVPVDLLVLDQVPCSEDERLRIQILQPKGLKAEGDTVRAGVSAKAQGADDNSSVRSGVGALMGKEEKWGKATAVLKKGGEVKFDVKLNQGQGVKLVLEYEARIPSSESIVGIEK